MLARVAATLARAVSIRRRAIRALGGATLIVLAGGCSFDRGPDIENATKFDRFPIYWLGAEYEGYEVGRVSASDQAIAAGLDYGTCSPEGFESSCTVPLQIQIFPLCYHLDSVALPPRARRRVVRGAPVGTQDDAPVLLTQ